MRELKVFFEIARQSNFARLLNVLWSKCARRLNLDRANIQVLIDQRLNKCKQVTASDVISGWKFSGPLADQIRRKNGSPVAIAQSGQDAPSPARFGISAESWVRLRWGGRWARKVVRGWSGRALAQYFSVRKMQDKNPKDVWALGVPAWYLEHQP